MSKFRLKVDPSWEPSWARLGPILEPTWGAKLAQNRSILGSVLRLALEIVFLARFGASWERFRGQVGSKNRAKT